MDRIGFITEYVLRHGASLGAENAAADAARAWDRIIDPKPAEKVMVPVDVTAVRDSLGLHR